MNRIKSGSAILLRGQNMSGPGQRAVNAEQVAVNQEMNSWKTELFGKCCWETPLLKFKPLGVYSGIGKLLFDYRLHANPTSTSLRQQLKYAIKASPKPQGRIDPHEKDWLCPAGRRD